MNLDAVLTKSEEKPQSGNKVKASPAVRKMAKNNNVDLSLVTPTGKGGTITKEDVEEFLAGPAPTPTPVPPAVQIAHGSAPAAAPKPIKRMLTDDFLPNHFKKCQFVLKQHRLVVLELSHLVLSPRPCRNL